MRRESYAGLRADTRRMLDYPEGRAIDFKRTPTAVSAEDIVALSNALGGTILVGVDESDTQEGQHGVIVGCDVSDAARNAVVSRARGCVPPIDIDIVIENTRRPHAQIMRIDVPPSATKPHCTQGGTYKIRIQGQNAALHPPQLLAMFLEREGDTFLERFGEAAAGLIEQLARTERNLDGQLVELEMTVQQAITAAEEAREAAAWAGEAAEAAAAAAEDRL